VQEAFALREEEAAAAPGGYVTEVTAGGSRYSVYVHRWAAGLLVGVLGGWGVGGLVRGGAGCM